MKTFTRSIRFAGTALLFGTMLNAYSATTDLATAPLITSPTSSVLPNIFLMMDDSGSMAWDYMPDNAGNFNAGTYGAASPQCNGMFYDHTITYTSPVDSTGASYANSSFTSAWNDGYNTTGGSTDLSTSFRDPGGDPVQPAFYYKYTGTQTTEKLKDYYNSSSQFYLECNSKVTTATITFSGTSSTTVTSVTVNGTTITVNSSTSSSSTMASNVASAINASGTGYTATSSSSKVTIAGISPADVGTTPSVSVSTGTMSSTTTAFSTTTGSGVFTKVLVTSTSGPGATDERTNFANWWSYYHTRILMMKTATGQAFSSLGTTFRVGFATINNNTGSDLLALNTFDATQKAAWYAKLYATRANNSTPLRQALADVGRMYAHKLPSTNSNNALTSSVPDPVQFSCQQNFTILTTDGFWNGPTPTDLSGNAIGNQDYFEPRPMYDGANYSTTTVTPYTTVQTRQTVTTGQTTTYTFTYTVTSIGSACTTPSITVSHTVSSLTDNGKTIAVGIASTNPNTSRCHQLAANAWICRSSSNPFSGSSVTDSTGTTWSLVNSFSGNTGCVSDRTAFGSGYSSSVGACQSKAGVGGSTVTTIPHSIVETATGYTATSVDQYTADQQTTQTTINGVVGPTSALTPSTLTYNFTGNLSYTSTVPTFTVGPDNAGTPNSVCTATASLPVPDPTSWATTTPTGWGTWDTPPYTTSITGGTATTTIVSTVGPTAGTPVVSSSNSGGTFNTLADVAEYYYITDLRTTALGNNLSGAPGAVNGTDISANNVPSSGLDAAAHQHMTTFTLGLGARGNMVFDPSYESETAANGGGDFWDVRSGNTANGSTVCPWQASGSCNWPVPASNSINNIDDLWHAAVDGRGTYFSAANPSDLATALSRALAGVSARTGSAAAATTSNAFVTQGDNFLFRSTFVSQQWTGELIRQQLDVTTGAVLPAIDWSAQALLDANAARNIYFFDASATNKLSSFTLANLTTAGLNSNFILPHIASLSQLCAVGATCLASWTPSTFYTAGDVYRNGTTWYQVNTAYTSGATFGALDTTNSTVTSGIEGLNLVAFLKGDRTYEGASTDTLTGKYYRQRNHVMGDIVSSESNYVKAALSPFYGDPGYKTGTSNFVTAMADRQAMVYVGGNDGMLHAFYAATDMMSSTTGHVVSTGGINVNGGDEAWAFIPTAVIPNLYKLADKNYPLQHQYYVDGSPVTADICISNCTSNTAAVWKTILVGGLNGGGTSYYALDITNPAHPIALWQFTDANMGYTYGNPKVVKLKTGEWVVLFTSGYNNTAGDGQGYLYVVDAYTGTLVTSVNGTGIIGTGVGSVATPSGLGKLDAPLVSPGVDATATAVYAGDMLGNLWRFDINGDLGAAGYDAQLLATLQGPSPAGNIQPITTKPLLSLVNNTVVIFVGTGRYLGSTDLSDTSQQSFYAIKDTYPAGTTPSVAIFGNPRTQGTFVQQTQTSTTCPVGTAATICTSGQSVVVTSNNAVSFSSNGGWYFDFPLAGERVNVDPAIIDQTLVINSNVPNASSCSVGGDSFQYQLNYLTGGSVSSSPTGVIATKLGNELTTRPVVATLLDGTNKAYSQGSGGGTPNESSVWSNKGNNNNTTATGVPTRKSWRELIQQ